MFRGETRRSVSKRLGLRTARKHSKTLESRVALKLTLTWAMTTNGVHNSGPIPLRRAVPFKRDVARRIDRVIDYFGASPRREHPTLRGRRRIRIATAEVDER